MLDIILDLARVFAASGKQLYMVGGSVRDLLLRRETSPDVDLTTDARPDEIKRLVAQTHPLVMVTVGEQFGTVRVHYQRATDDGQQQSTGGEGEVIAAITGEFVSPEPTALVTDHTPEIDVIEITTFRSDRYDPDSRKPEVTFGDRLEDDLLRRDFTINAMARDPLTGAIIDPYGGRDDLALQLVRAVGDDPEHRFDEDPLRLLRAARFAAQLGFAIEERTADAMARQAATLGKISRERVRDEFTKLLVSPEPMRGLRLLVDSGLMAYIVPEALELRGVSQRPVHSKDVYEHVLRVVANTPPRPATRWAGLLHDIAKPRTRSVEDGKVHFFGHEEVGAGMARDILRRLKFDRPFIDRVVRLVRMHMRANAYLSDWTDGAVRRLMLEAGNALPDLLDLSRADITSYRPERVSRAAARVTELEERTRRLREEAERVPLKSPLDGNDLMALFGRGPGPWLRPVKDHLLGLVIDGQLAPDDRVAAEAEARRFVAELESTGSSANAS
jgi:poly(A) polymerase